MRDLEEWRVGKMKKMDQLLELRWVWLVVKKYEITVQERCYGKKDKMMKFKVVQEMSPSKFMTLSRESHYLGSSGSVLFISHVLNVDIHLTTFSRPYQLLGYLTVGVYVHIVYIDTYSVCSSEGVCVKLTLC